VYVTRSNLVLRTVKLNTQIALLRYRNREGTESPSQLPSTGTNRPTFAAQAGRMDLARQGSRIRLDDFDRRILDVLSANARIHNTELARRICLSPAPCLRRVRALENAGIIRQYTAVIDYEALGLVLAVVRVQFDPENRRMRKLFERRLFEIPEIFLAYCTNGESDYVLGAYVHGLKSLAPLLEDSLLMQPGVKGLQSAICLRDCLRDRSSRRGVAIPAPSEAPAEARGPLRA
jgi:DNA-binding Lrp family transcriptional regulator